MFWLEVLTEHRAGLERVAAALLEKEELTGEEVSAIVGERRNAPPPAVGPVPAARESG